MKVTEFERNGRSFEIRLVKGDEVLSALARFAKEQKVSNASFTALGTLDKAQLGWRDGDLYKVNPINEEVEIASLVGNIRPGQDGKIAVHAHLVLGLKDGTTRGGHLLEGTVSGLLDLFVQELITK